MRSRPPRRAPPPRPVVGVTRTTVTVAGLVGGEADLGRRRPRRAGALRPRQPARWRGGTHRRVLRHSALPTPPSELAGSVFAVVPAVSDALDTAGLAQAGVPFVGAASTTGWDGNTARLRLRGRAGRVADPRRRARPGVRSCARCSAPRRAHTSRSRSTTTRSAPRVRSRPGAPLRAAGFQVADPVALPAPPTPLPDLAPASRRSTAGSPAVALLLTSPATTTGLAQRLTAAGFTGTVATTDAFYQPATPAIANGLTVLVPYAPFEQTTPANRRLATDVESFAPGTTLTPGVAAGYWSADVFLRMLAKVGRRLTRERFLAVANRNFSFSVPGTVGALDLARDAHPGRAVRGAGAERRHALPRGRAVRVRRPDRAARRRPRRSTKQYGASVAVVEAEADLHRHLVPGDRIRRSSRRGCRSPRTSRGCAASSPRARCRCGSRRRHPLPTSRRSP